MNQTDYRFQKEEAPTKVCQNGGEHDSLNVENSLENRSITVKESQLRSSFEK